MTKADLIDSVAKAAKLSNKGAGEAVDATFENIARAIRLYEQEPGESKHKYKLHSTIELPEGPDECSTTRLTSTTAVGSAVPARLFRWPSAARPVRPGASLG